jgi:hypothetical protein
LNTNIIEHFRTFLTRVITQSFDFEQESYDQLKLMDLTRYDFLVRIIFTFLSIISFVGFNGSQN